jgi:hypothetical protein
LLQMEYGKSSFSIAFDSLKSGKLELDDKNYHKGNVGNRPELKVVIEESVGQKTLIANDMTNNIFQCFCH